MKRFIAIAAVAASLLSCAGAQVQPEPVYPRDILDQAAATYRSLQTYASEGTVSTELEIGGSKASAETTFSIRLAKPNRYVITWAQTNPTMPDLVQSGAVWSDGTQPYLYLGPTNAYARMNGDAMALGGATGVSGGAAMTIPSLFLAAFDGMPGLTSRIVDPVLVGTEKVGDEECFVIGGSSAISKQETLWISTRDHLLRRYRRLIEPPAGGPMKGSSTEVYAVVRTPALGPQDFVYAPPAGAALKASLFEGLAGSAKSLAAASRQVGATRLALEGHKLSAQDAEALEKRVAEHPDDVASRTKLLGYYSDSSAGEARRRHVLWLIENAPESEILSLPFGHLDGSSDREGYQQGKAAWIAAMQKDPQNLKLVASAAKYFLLYDRDLARETLEKGRALDGKNPAWSSELGHSWMLQANRRGETDVAAARMALERYEEAYGLATGMEKDLLVKPLAEAALAAGDRVKAAKHAGKLLAEPGGGWNRGNNIHQGNIILGRLALLSNDVEEAKRRLLEAGETPGSPQLGSFGPNMALARELLLKGERDTVLKYFELCEVFWGLGKEKLQAWTAAVKDGKLPEFGANLVY